MNLGEPSLSRRFWKASRAAGFSLTEVAMAIAIVGFALVSLVALLPAGLGQFRQAMNATISAQISQHVVTDAEQTDFQQLLNSAETTDSEFFVLPVRYFDEQGNEILPSNPQKPSSEEAARIIYQVRIRGSLPGPANTESGAGGESFASLPASNGSPRFRPRDSTFLTVQVALNPGGAQLPVNDRSLWTSKTGGIFTYTAVITRNGYPRGTKL